MRNSGVLLGRGTSPVVTIGSYHQGYHSLICEDKGTLITLEDDNYVRMIINYYFLIHLKIML